jgi:alpha-beta hydrolase superfamily lysophospholipase
LGSILSVLHLVSSNQDSPRGAVVFVHGLCGHPFKSWQADDYSTFWPLWLAADLPEIAVYTLEYEAGASNWFGESMQLPDRATDVLAELASRDLDRLPIVFVCHSLGGLVAKQVLRVRSARHRWYRCFRQHARCRVSGHAEYGGSPFELG